jgi:hypothetical protein
MRCWWTRTQTYTYSWKTPAAPAPIRISSIAMIPTTKGTLPGTKYDWVFFKLEIAETVN